MSIQNCMKHASLKLRTTNDVVKTDSESFRTIANELGEQWTTAYIRLWILYLNKFVSANRTFNDDQVNYVTDKIFLEYSMTIPDLVYFIRKVIEGHFGQLYENLSTDKFFEWFNKYWDDRLECAAEINRQKSENTKVTLNNINPEVAKEMLGAFKEEPVKYNIEPNGLGSRVKKKQAMDNQGVVIPRKYYLNGMFSQILCMTAEELRNYIATNDVESDEFDPDVFKMVEEELDRRANIKEKDCTVCGKTIAEQQGSECESSHNCYRFHLIK